jgi:hypothetical protein
MWKWMLQVCCSSPKPPKLLRLAATAERRTNTPLQACVLSLFSANSVCLCVGLVELPVCLLAPGCVKDIRRVLVEQHGLAKCALYLQVGALHSAQLQHALEVAVEAAGAAAYL